MTGIEGPEVKGRWPHTCDWPLVAIIVLVLALLVFLFADMWMPRPFPHV